ncbi:MAG: 16S rRNA (guanine(966)-N(2))-methyltransferase RsmD [Cyanobacteriota bacterium]|nr:16S rRNA (guanine(966)-N(2))-methyltransferase RsmD [Cyanobacteriota bacterium]
MSLRVSGGRRLLSPPGLRARPTPSRVRLAVMNLLATRLAGCSWLDLFSGSGAMACEALLHGAARVVAVERDRRHAAVVRSNLEAVASGLAQPELRVHCGDVLGWLRAGWEARGEQPFELIYADPPYSAGLLEPVAELVARERWLSSKGLMLLECRSETSFRAPEGWSLVDRRRYGSSSVLRLTQS